MPEIGMKVEGMTLGNVCDGDVETQFQDCLEKVVEFFHEPEKYEHVKDLLTVAIKIEVNLYRDSETGSISVYGAANAKPPKRQGKLRAAFVENGVVLVQPEVSAPLFPKVRSIKDPES